MSVSKWAYEPEKCDGAPCPGDCDFCSRADGGLSLCDTCLNSRTIVSENGYHPVCCLSSGKAVDCMFNGKYYAPHPACRAVKEKEYSSGMYGGKFMPFHRGHMYCLEEAAALCDKVYLLLVTGGKDEERIACDDTLSPEIRRMMSPEARWNKIVEIANLFGNVIPVRVDVSDCRDENGEESWDMETPRVIAVCGHFDAVFGSEPEYAPYFKRAYPWATYELVDPKRENVPISATMIRGMDMEEAKQWIV